MASGSTKAVLAALFANLGIAIAKFVGYAFTSSSSMLAEAIHSVADTSNQALLLLGNRRAEMDATPDHPFGFGRERYFWSFIVALVLFTLGGLFAIYEGWHKLGEESHEVSNVQWAIAILVLGIILEGYSFRTAAKQSRPLKGEATWWQFIRHSRTPELPVVLLEDLGALIGLVLALLGISTAAITGDSRWDAYGTIAIGVLLVVIATVLVFEMKSLLIGESAVAPMRKTIVEAIVGAENVDAVLHMRTEHIGPDELLVAAKVQLTPGLDTAGVAAAINRAEQRVREAISIECVIYLEPDVFDPQHPGLAKG
ncbi:MAG: cation diffusion facilitator family transporter [Deltaproteobacteria bacterium]|nr:cation diffusion facilitator family transporter [Deltaproteobacteria bacterium]MBW1875388.1 cation diffusion facilitator family transporter [Deltaproteobacteria bacterium]MBW2210007.1 cation diffusion facilitator family transporter [Deltaproteobacteria bacterium]MBW2214989.1 cation diffusion facilitator family transporter [Deltaproteobacteria bacterium]MBW2379421.1 cation diffusion facilitator family transporter [Deltaproteobacteria bacterium]